MVLIAPIRIRQRLIQIPQDVVDILDADAQADEIRRDPGGCLFLRAQLAWVVLAG